MSHSSLREFESSTGAALVEMAIVIFLLLLLTFGVMEYGWMLFRMQQVNNAAREGVRQAVLPDATGSTMDAAISFTMSSSGMGGSGYSADPSPSDITAVDPGELITVTVSVPYANIQLLGISFLGTPDSLTASATMAKEGP